MSEVLGLTWEDLDLDAATAHVRFGAAYTRSAGTTLGPTKTLGAGVVHLVAAVSVEHLRRRRAKQDADRLRLGGTPWPKHTDDGERLSMVFTAASGELVNRQAVLTTFERAAKVDRGAEPSQAAPAQGLVAGGSQQLSPGRAT